MGYGVIRPDDPYLGWRPGLSVPELRPQNSALLVIDMQYSCASPDEGLLRFRRENGFTNGLDYVTDRLKLAVPNIRRLQEAFRVRGFEVIFARIRALRSDGRDRSRAHKERLNSAPPGTRSAEILEELRPLEGEMVFNKTTASVFNSTTIDYVLRNMGIENLVVVGMLTSGCVESSVRDASDLGYRVMAVEDGCVTWSPEMQAASIRVMDEVFAKVTSTEAVLSALRPAGC